MQNQRTTAESPWTIIKVIQWATNYFKTHDIDSPRATAEILLAHALKCTRMDLYLNHDQPLVTRELDVFKSLIKRRIKREPVAYIVGVREFWSMDLEVTGDVLIPRPETECLVEAALDLCAQHSASHSLRVLDVGTGSGAIVLALASVQMEHVYFASDLFFNAATLASKNAARHGLSNKVRFFVGDWFATLNPQKSRFDMILSNPPYIPSAVIPKLQPEIHLFEPLAALNGAKDGLGSIRAIISCAHLYLNPNGMLLLEIGHEQKKDVDRIACECGHYQDILFKKDYSGCDRVVQMRKKNQISSSAS
jgi:release factor glutamine methyltransferase